MCGLELGVALQGHTTWQWWSRGLSRKGGAGSSQGVLLPSPSSQGWGLCSRGDRPLPQETQWPSIPPPFPLPPVRLPSPTDKPPVPPNQVSLLLHACSAELYQLPLMACRPGPLLALRVGEGKLG